MATHAGASLTQHDPVNFRYMLPPRPLKLGAEAEKVAPVAKIGHGTERISSVATLSVSPSAHDTECLSQLGDDTECLSQLGNDTECLSQLGDDTEYLSQLGDDTECLSQLGNDTEYLSQL